MDSKDEKTVAVGAPTESITTSNLCDMMEKMEKRLGSMMDKRFDHFSQVMDKRFDHFSQVMDKRFDHLGQVMKVDVEKATGQSEIRMLAAVGESEGRMMAVLIEVEGRLQASATAAEDRLTDKFTKLEKELGQELRKELDTAHMVKWNTMHESYKALVLQVRDKPAFSPTHDLENINLEGLPPRTQEYMVNLGQQVAQLHSLFQAAAFRDMDFPVLVQKERDSYFGEFKEQVMNKLLEQDYRNEQFTKKVTAMVARDEGTGDKLG